jgi:GT2 family glycosyltransferase
MTESMRRDSGVRSPQPEGRVGGREFSVRNGAEAELSDAEQQLAVLVVSYRQRELLERCLKSIEKWVPNAQGVFVWDNASERSEEIRMLQTRFPDVEFAFCNENIGFAAAVNRLVQLTHAEWFLLLNPDAQLVASPASMLQVVTKDALVAAVGPWTLSARARRPWDNAVRQIHPINAAFDAAGITGFRRVPLIRTRYPYPPTMPGYISGACLLVSRNAWERVGPFDERFWLYSEEVDWARRARLAGYRIVQVPAMVVHHDPGGTVNDDERMSQFSEDWLTVSRSLYLEKHFGRAGLLVHQALVKILVPIAALLRPVRRVVGRHARRARRRHDV